MDYNNRAEETEKQNSKDEWGNPHTNGRTTLTRVILRKFKINYKYH